jgi:hypothetical protein
MKEERLVSKKTSMNLSKNNFQWAKSLAAAAILLCFVHALNAALGWPSWYFRFLFDMERETTLQTWFSSVLWIFAAFQAFECAKHEWNADFRKIWRLAGGGFAFLSLDEAAMIHERTGDIIYKVLIQAGFPLKLTTSIAPVVLSPFIFLAIGGAVILLRSPFRNSDAAPRLMMAGAVALVAGGIVLDATTNGLNHESLEWLWQVEVIFEEGLEMFGAILMITGLRAHREYLALAGRSYLSEKVENYNDVLTHIESGLKFERAERPAGGN